MSRPSTSGNIKEANLRLMLVVTNGNNKCKVNCSHYSGGNIVCSLTYITIGTEKSNKKYLHENIPVLTVTVTCSSIN